MIHTGDLITEGMPVLDYNNGASAVEWVTVLDKILELDFDTVIPGHGPLLTKERIRSDRQKLVMMNQRMAELARKGVPLEQVFDGLKLADLGWDHTVSTVAFRGWLEGVLRGDEVAECDEVESGFSRTRDDSHLVDA